MIKDVVLELMTETFILWRCLHSGPLSVQTIDQWPSDGQLPWERFRKRNVGLLTKLIRTYGSCAIIARDGAKTVGTLRFYPKVIADAPGAGGLCLQQEYPSGPSDGFVDNDFPALARIENKTLSVHCLMTGSPQQKENPYQHQGLGTRMVRTLIQWAKAKGWDRIEAISFEDLPIIYDITGCAGHTFWEKLGFSVADRFPHPALQEKSEFVLELEKQAEAIGIPSERARDQIVMRLEIT